MGKDITAQIGNNPLARTMMNSLVMALGITIGKIALDVVGVVVRKYSLVSCV